MRSARAAADEERRACLKNKWEALEREEKLVSDERRELATSWRDVEKKQAKLAADRALFEQKVGEMDFVEDGETVFKLNVGGQVFEIAAKHLMKDRFSLLASVCTRSCALRPDNAGSGGGHGGAFFFDRDWWIFRHIYLFLLDGTLPQSMATLRELYYEAAFYRLALLRYAVEARILEDCERKRGGGAATAARATAAAHAETTRGRYGDEDGFATLPGAGGRGVHVHEHEQRGLGGHGGGGGGGGGYGGSRRAGGFAAERFGSASGYGLAAPPLADPYGFTDTY